MKKSILAGLAILAALCLPALSASASVAGATPVAFAIAEPVQAHAMAQAKEADGFALAPAAVLPEGYGLGEPARVPLASRSPAAATALTATMPVHAQTAAGERWRS